MINSNADECAFQFAQHTDSGMCHLSFTETGGMIAINMQISMDDAIKLCQNLMRCVEADRCRIKQDLRDLLDGYDGK